MSRTQPSVIVDYRAEGWPQTESERSTPTGTKLCCSQLKRHIAQRPPCHAATVRRVTTKTPRRGSYADVGYYCDDDLPFQYRQGPDDAYPLGKDGQTSLL
jgi:hypothetical protein